MSGALPQVAVETPRQAAHRLFAKDIAAGFTPVALHCYSDSEGVPSFYRPRLKRPDGRKVIKPMHLDGDGFVMGEPKAPPEGKLLYNLPAIVAANSSKPVFIVEGEYCVDALAHVGVIATTSGGCTSADAANWAPLRGRQCIVWRDNDEPGTKYAEAVTAKLRGIASVSLVADEVVQALPEHGDCADWLHEHPNATAAEVLALPTSSSHYEQAAKS